MKKNNSMSRTRTIFKWIFRILGIYLIYIAVSLTVPFLGSPDVSQDFKDSFDINEFYSDETGVDRAAVVESSQDALDVRLHMINEAKEKIAISSFSLKTDRACNEIASVLLAAADRGVTVQILVDGLSGWYDMKNDPIYYVLGTHANIELRYYNQLDLLRPWTFNGRLHDKYILIDDELLLLGGRNVSNYFLGEYDTKVLSYDRDIFVYNTAYGSDNISDSVIYEVWDYFNAIWNHEESKQVFDYVSSFKKDKVADAKQTLLATYQELITERKDLFARADYREFTVPTNKITLVSNPTHIMTKEPYIWYTMMQLMSTAKERVYIQTPYAVLNRDMYAGLTDIAETVPDVRMLLNSRAGGDNFMASSDYTLNKKKVLKTGVTLYEFQGIHSMHDKSFLIDDDISVIGSYNLDMRSTYLDTEVMLVVHGTEFNDQLEQYMYAMQDGSLLVGDDGSYEENNEVTALKLPLYKKALFSVTSVVFQLFRYLL